MNPENNYFSDNEDNNSIDELYESDNSIDDETRRLVYDAIKKRDNENDYENLEIENKKNNNQKNKSKKNKKSLSLDEFCKKLDKEEEINKPKKFVSLRAENKKKN